MKLSFRCSAGRILPLLAVALTAACSVQAAPRGITFHVAAACNCAQCSFDAYRTLKKFDGVTKTTLSLKDKRLDIMFEEHSKTVSDLAGSIGKLDMGKKNELIWPVDAAVGAAAEAQSLCKVDGVASAKASADGKSVGVTFKGKPAVSLAQLDAASKGDTPR